jgi:hypothetical protein
MSWILPSLKVPVAVNCCVSPSGSDGIAGVTEIVDSVAAVTVRFPEPTTEPNVAVICVVPVAAVIASPVALTDAIEVLADAQLTWVVRFRVLPSVNMPVAANC